MYLLKATKHTTPLLLLLLLWAFGSTYAADFRVENYVQKNDNGYFQLEWSAEENAEIILQQATSPSFDDAKNIYQGVDRATFISGLANGSYYYRVKEIDGTWSPTYLVTVQHQSLQLAYTLFGLGAVVFLLTVLVVVRGTKQAKHE